MLNACFSYDPHTADSTKSVWALLLHLLLDLRLYHIFAVVSQVIKFVCVQVLQLQLLQDEQNAKHQRQIVSLKDELAQLRCTHLQCVSSLQASKKETLVNCLPLVVLLVFPAHGRHLKADSIVHPFFLRHNLCLTYCRFGFLISA